MASGEDFDYMSDEFLAQCVQEDIRPGLIHNRTQQRNHEIQKKRDIMNEANKHRFKPHKLIEAERREEGLKVAISDDNKGFALLQKMGYKPGTAIGKSGSGRVDPIPLQVKEDRQGLGRATALKEIAQAKKDIRARYQKRREELTEDFRARMARKANERQVDADLRKSQRMCERFDKDKEIEQPAEWWFWPESSLPKDDEDEDEEESDEEEDKEEEEHKDKGEDESKAAVKGSNPESSGLKASEKDQATDNGEEDEEIEYEPPEMLDVLTLYLRRTYCYCVWCGAQYDDDKDLRDSCPGPSREYH